MPRYLQGENSKVVCTIRFTFLITDALHRIVSSHNPRMLCSHDQEMANFQTLLLLVFSKLDLIDSRVINKKDFLTSSIMFLPSIIFCAFYCHQSSSAFVQDLLDKTEGT